MELGGQSTSRFRRANDNGQNYSKLLTRPNFLRPKFFKTSSNSFAFVKFAIHPLKNCVWFKVPIKLTINTIYQEILIWLKILVKFVAQKGANKLNKTVTTVIFPFAFILLLCFHEKETLKLLFNMDHLQSTAFNH